MVVPHYPEGLLLCEKSPISSIPDFLSLGLIVLKAHILHDFPEKVYTGDKNFACLNWPPLRLDG